jgi:O-antigen ligase/tetratricopeptide (TPR) repeat protein
MEGVVLVLAVLTPWAFGGVDPVFELLIAAGLTLLLLLWAALVVAAGRLSIVRCPVTLVLGLVFVAGLVQLVPLPPALLGVVSPGASQIRQEMYPQKPEQLTPDQPAVGRPTGPTTTVYPHATRANLFRWLGLLVLFAAVRNQVASTGSLWRLSLVMLINGCLLATLGLVQALRARHEIYGFPVGNVEFGPFINRNHFAAYINMCIALGVGLLVWLGPTEQDRKQRYMVKPNAPMEQREVWGTIFSPFVVLHSPAQLWTLMGVGLMAAALMCSLSRGGFVSLLIALIATMCLRLSWPPRIRRLEVLLIPIVFIFGLFAFIGFRPLETRLGALFHGGSTAADARWSMWSDLASLAPRFWLLGSGYGTLGYVEPLARSATTFTEPATFVEHAHNDYLEALIEGGIVRGVLTLLLVGLIFAGGFRGLRRYVGRTPGALAVGAMTGFLAIALHSAVDFSMTTPAVAILAAIVAAQLVALNRADPTKPPEFDHARARSVDLGPIRFGLVCTMAIGLGGLMMLHCWQTDRAYRLKLAAFRSVNRQVIGDSPNHDMAVDYLKAAVAVAPDDAEMQADFGQELLDFGGYARVHMHTRLPAAPFFLAVGAGSVPAAIGSLAVGNDSLYMNGPLPEEQKATLFRKYTVPALEHFAMARRLCPLLARPQMRFAAHARELKNADPPSAYWDRALQLAPFDPDLWFFAGVQRLRDGESDKAWQAWRTSLQLFPHRPNDFQKVDLKEHLTVMVKAAIARAGSDPRRIGDLLNGIIPDRPVELLSAAELVDSSLSASGPARPLLERALLLLTDRAEGLPPEQYHLKARLLIKLGDPDGAVRAYTQAFAAAIVPGSIPQSTELEWRLEFVKLLIDERRWKEARQQLRQLPMAERDQVRVKNWLDEVNRELRLEGTP